MPNAEHSIELKGLHEDNPRDFLAALGLLRLVALLWPQLHARMGWCGDPMTAKVVTASPLPGDWNERAVTSLQDLLEHDPDPIRHGNVIKTTVNCYREAAKRALRFRENQCELADLPSLLYAAYSSQIEPKGAKKIKEGKEIEPSWFSFANGQSGKNLLKDVGELIQSIDGSELLNTLKGEASPKEAKALRWNPMEFRAAAYRGPDPGDNAKGDTTLDFPAFNVLAFIGLTFFPSVPTRDGGKTLGCVEKPNQKYFQWPIWEVPLGCDELATLLQTSLQDIKSNRHQGVVCMWRSRKFYPDQYGVYFSPAKVAS
ncbi:MAG: hypothetical protein M2R45_00440 [Verrucomicrobia subdivision 3 bacterium]|nr:hypothetical protein [Limisphaerales bacterium]MCS1413680.1 hypothetical protein [Limisphaerales bacterium]